MVDTFSYPYRISVSDGKDVHTFPSVEISIQDKFGQWLTLFFLVDSGATISVLPRSDADVFGIDVENGLRVNVLGIGGEFLTGWKHNLKVRFGNKDMLLPIIFIDNEIAPRILGREGIFERFVLVFEETRRRTGFIVEYSGRSKFIHRIFDKI